MFGPVDQRYRLLAVRKEKELKVASVITAANKKKSAGTGKGQIASPSASAEAFTSPASAALTTSPQEAAPQFSPSDAIIEEETPSDSPSSNATLVTSSPPAAPTLGSAVSAPSSSSSSSASPGSSRPTGIIDYSRQLDLSLK